ncbi:MAG TPA: hypothetical protein VND22_04740 [Actinomycetota bacterium]|nr:hypothetical protein [Actinomycetota bacterium]
MTVDSPFERYLAALLGGCGTLIGVLAIEIIPDLYNLPGLHIHLTRFALMCVFVFLAGAAGGRVGHHAFLHMAKGGAVSRALKVGGLVGAAIGGICWLATYVAPGLFFPFETVVGFRGHLLSHVLPRSLGAGAAGGMIVALGVVYRLRKQTGKREPLEIEENIETG